MLLLFIASAIADFTIAIAASAYLGFCGNIDLTVLILLMLFNTAIAVSTIAVYC